MVAILLRDVFYKYFICEKRVLLTILQVTYVIIVNNIDSFKIVSFDEFYMLILLSLYHDHNGN